MSSKSKSLLALLGTLVLGFVIGVLASGFVRQQRVQKLERMPRHERFERVMKRIIQPTGEQQAALDTILETHFQRMAGVRESYEDRVFALFDSLHQDLSSLLTEEQQHRLREHLKRGPSDALEERIQHLAHDLDLSDEQREQLDKIIERHWPPPFSIEFETGERPDSRRSQLRNWLKALHRDIDAILTPEQREKLHDLRRHRPFPGRFGRPFDSHPRKD